MKANLFSILAIAITAVFFVSCKPKANEDRLDTIIKDLAADSYSLSFDKTYPEQGVTQTSYGAESFLVYAEPQDVICPEPFRMRFPKAKIPVFVIPKIVQPTCPTMIPFDIAGKLTTLLEKADPAVFGGLKQIKVSDTKVLLANDKFTAQFANLQADMMDDSVLNNFDGSKYLLLQAPGNMYAGFTRGFYGYAGLNDLMPAKANIDFKKIFRPIYIGCFDPVIMASLKDILLKMNPEVYRSLQVNPLQESANIATLSMMQ